MLVAPNTPCHAKALEVLEAYQDYPVIDEELWSSMEYGEILDNCDQAFSSWYYHLAHELPTSEVAMEVSHYIYSYVSDIGNELREDSWPKDEAIFWGYVAYRLAKKHASQ